MPRDCVLCMESDTEEKPLLELPCFNHWVCHDCISHYFVNATNNENLFPPQCCEEPISIVKYEEYVPEDVQLAYYLKEQGEYTILPKYRVYCASEACGKFIHPIGHIEDKKINVTYAVCDSDNCFQATCCACKTLIIDDIQDHVCPAQELDRESKEAVDKYGYKECFTCGAIVELAEACNHITCECGSEFCYVCGKQWDGVHGCPHYGPATYDADGYNEAGYHRDTGLNREGRTHSEEMAHQNGSGPAEGDGNNGDDNEGEGETEGEGILQRVMNQLEPDQRAMIESLDEETRDEALLQIMDAWVNQGVVLDLPQLQDDEEEAPAPRDPDPELPIEISDADEENTVEHEGPIILEPIPEPLIDISDIDQEHVVEHEGPAIWEPAPELLADLSEDLGPVT